MERQVTSQEGVLEEGRRGRRHGAGLTRLGCSAHVTLELPLETSRVAGLQDHAHGCPPLGPPLSTSGSHPASYQPRPQQVGLGTQAS